MSRVQLGCALGLVLLAAGVGRAQGRNEYELKAAFVVNFARFIEWPADAFARADSPLVVCVAGKAPIEGGFDRAINGSRAGGHELRAQPVETAEVCHILFVGASEAPRFAQLLRSVDYDRTVAIGEHKRFIEAGGVINLVKDDTLLRFDINIKATARARYRLSSKLLALAYRHSSEVMP